MIDNLTTQFCSHELVECSVIHRQKLNCTSLMSVYHFQFASYKNVNESQMNVNIGSRLLTQGQVPVYR